MEVRLTQVKGVAQFDGHLLLLLENELVVGHVLLGIHLKIAFQLMQIQTLFVGTLLSIQEKLTKLGCPKRSSNQSLIVHKLIH